MKIKLGNGYILNSDSYCVWISKEVHNKKGTGCYERVFNGYHGNLRQCLQSFLVKALNMSEAETIKQLASEIRHIEETIDRFCDEIKEDLRKIPNAD